MSLRSLPARLFVAAFFSILSGAIPAGIARADDCSNEASLKSPPSSEASRLSFQNGSGDKRRIYWIDQNGARKFYGVVDPGNTFQQSTFAGHAWIVTDEAEKCLYTFVASAAPQTVSVGGQAAAGAVVAPPPGREVAQTPAPPANNRSPPLTATDNPPVTNETVPQVSPIEQLQLKGLYRLITQLDATRMLNSEASGVLDASQAPPDWDSAMWSFEAVTGTPFVRIKNNWKKTYLADSGGTPKAIAAAPEASEAQWTIEPVDGTLYVQFRNRESDRFLLAVNGAATLADDFGQDQENSSHWRLAAVIPGSTEALPPPPPSRPLYDAALLNCRSIGGIWTGSSCRRPDYMTGPLACPRGFFWADDIGECLWDGPRCPPWQTGPGGACGVNLVCVGGRVAPGPRGYPACYCPPGTVTWGNYPRLSCVPSVARIVPLLVPAIVGGVAIGIVSGGHGRQPIGQLFGNQKYGHGQIGNNTPVGSTIPVKTGGGGSRPFGPGGGKPPTSGGNTTGPAGGGGQIGSAVSSTIDPKTGVQTNTTVDPKTGATTTQQVCAAGYTGSPPNCLKPSTSSGPTGGGATCVGGMQSAGACICPQGTAPVGSGNNFTCVAGAKPSQNIPCKIGQSRNSAGDCVDTNSLVTCTGGTVVQGVCGCPSGMNPVGSGTTFKCEASKVIRQQQSTCSSGQSPAKDNCNCPSSTMSLVGGVCTTSTVAKPITPQTCASGQRPATDNCLCPPSTMSLVGGVCTTSTAAKPNPTGGGTNTGGGQTTGAPATCASGQRPSVDKCTCASPMRAVAGVCTSTPNNPNNRRNACSAGEPVASCDCVSPMSVVNGRCVNPASGTTTNPDPNCSTCDVKQVPQTQQKTQSGQTDQKGQTQQQGQRSQKQDQNQKDQQDKLKQQQDQQKLQQQKDLEAQQKLKQQQDQQKLQQQKQLQEQQQKLQQQQQQQQQQKLQQQQQQQRQQQQQQQKQQQQLQQQLQQKSGGTACPPPHKQGPGGRCI
jgi:hypothetical protein